VKRPDAEGEPEAVDRDLVERAKRGDRAAYESLARDSAQRVFLICQRILRDYDLAEDAAQRALVEMWRDLPGLRDPDRFEAWSYRLAVRCSVAEARRERRLRGHILPLSDDPPGAPDELSAIAERDALEEAFGQLSSDHRAVIVLRYFVGLSLEEIAGVVAVPVGTVASRLHYALAGLRRTLGADEPSIATKKGLPA
jgi:RNA polymerase sigma-70 factor (ECF subfamily)